jgi:transcriptional regulator with XRE-family HTH domain
MQKKLHPIDVFAGNQLRMARKRIEISQSELAGQLTEPISFQQIQKYERGSNRMSASKIWEFAEALELPPAYFFPDTDRPTSQCETASETKLLMTFRELSKQKQNALMVLLEND